MGPRSNSRPWICSQTLICCQTCYWLRYVAQYWSNDLRELEFFMNLTIFIKVAKIIRNYILSQYYSQNVAERFIRVRTDLKSTWIYRTVLKCPWKLNLPWKVLEKHWTALKSPWILPFTGGFNRFFLDLNQYKIVVPYSVQHNMLHQIKAPQFYTNFLKLISLVMDSGTSEVEF